MPTITEQGSAVLQLSLMGSAGISTEAGLFQDRAPGEHREQD